MAAKKCHAICMAFSFYKSEMCIRDRLNIFYFAVVPIYPISGGQKKLPFQKLMSQKLFWLVIVLMVCAGASERCV